eukprot:scaffold2600_cov238-Pinguiococcus_pyrenoidosus.AAC.10
MDVQRKLRERFRSSNSAPAILREDPASGTCGPDLLGHSSDGSKLRRRGEVFRSRGSRDSRARVGVGATCKIVKHECPSWCQWEKGSAACGTDWRPSRNNAVSVVSYAA